MATNSKIGTTQIKVLERLCNASGVSGDESEVRAIVREQVGPFADDLRVDTLGNLLVTRNGAGRKKLRVMLAAHMDEVGFMLTADENDGIFRFDTVGGLDARQLAGKAVLIGIDHLPGVIGARPIHLMTQEERRRSLTVDQLRIDIGPGGGKVKIGDRAAFATRFRREGQAIFAKALDNRLGVATLIELFRNAPPNIDLLAAFTVQEEVGLRGAKVAAYALNPDLAIAIDCTPAVDLPAYDGSENTGYNTRLGHGPAIYIADGSTISDPRLVRFLAETAEKEKIPFQFRQPGGGGTDAGMIHRQREGIPSISVSIPGRHAHTAVALAWLDDWKNTHALMDVALRRMTAALLA